MNPIKILIADDHTILRQGLVGILEGYPDLCVVAEADNGLSMVNKYFAFHPDIVLSDIEMPELNGIDAAREILEKDSSAKILFLSMYNSEENICRLLQIKAYGLISKEVIKNELLLAIRTVAKGGTYFQGRSEEEIQNIRLKYSAKVYRSFEEGTAVITSAEKKILLYIADGKTSQEIAALSNKSKRTVDSVRAALMTKLSLHSLPQLIKYAIDYSFSFKEKKEE